jgi:hypothetical protein
MAKKQKIFSDFLVSDRDLAYQWLSENKSNLPDAVKVLFDHYKTIAEELGDSTSKRNTLLMQLRRALGIAANSERKKNRSEKTNDDKRGSLVSDQKHHKDRRDWHKSQVKKHNMMMKDIEKKIKSIDDIVLSEEDNAEIRAETDRETKVLESGGEVDPTLFTPKEALMKGLEAQIVEEEVNCLLPDLPSGESYTNTFTESRTRYDFSFQVAAIHIHVEKGLNEFGHMVTASTRDLGPPNFQITWNFLANMTLFVTQYAIPFERLARLLSSQDKTFHSSQICRCFNYVAKQLLPIYLHLFEKLSTSTLLAGDDTVIRVNEVNAATQAGTCSWQDYATAEDAVKFVEQNSTIDLLGPQIATELGFEFNKKNGDGPKKKLYTSVVWGKSELNPESYTIFYRSHIGNFGNLLDKLLLNRPQNQKKLFIQSDLFNGNLVSDETLLNKLDITWFGCAAHARRPFALHENEDPLCAAILAEFRNIYSHEKCLDLYGRNKTNVLQLRSEFSIKYWKSILEYCHMLCNRWSQQTPIGVGARYVIKNFEKLTAYLNHPIVPLTNDVSERMLRMEKLIQANSLFRTSLEGRFALDICRTVVQTALAAGVDVKDYLLHVFKQKDIRNNVAKLTPFAFSQKQI